MLKNFLIICICVCCVISIFALPHRWTYDNVQIAFSRIDDQSSVVRDDFNTASLLSYYWIDRLSIDYSAGDRIGIGRGDGSDPNKPTNMLVYWFYNIHTTDLDDPSSYYRYEVLYYSDDEAAAFAYDMFNTVFEYSSVIDWASADNILQNVTLGVVSVVQFVGLVVALLFTGVYFIFDVFTVAVVLVQQALWLLGFI